MKYNSLKSKDDVWSWARLLVESLNKRDTEISKQTIPVGGAITFRSGMPPIGYLLEDGASYAVADYPALFAVIGYAYGGAGANFNVPNSGATTAIRSGS